jgi:hypothetical protein
MAALLLGGACGQSAIPSGPGGPVLSPPDLSQPPAVIPSDMAEPADGGSSSDAAAAASALFGPLSTVNLPSDFTAHSVGIGDVTGDGLPDVVVAGSINFTQNNDEVLVLPQTAAHTLGTPVRYDTGYRSLVHLAVVVADVNSDGRLDVVVTRSFDVGVLAQNVTGTLDPLQPLTGVQPGHGIDDVAVADLDGDGRNDVVASGSPMVVWFQTMPGKLASAATFPCPAQGVYGIAVGDVDGDGKLDLVHDGCVLLQRPGGFAPFSPLSLGISTWGIAIGDVNGDSLSDLVFTHAENRPNSYLGIMLQTAQHTLAAQTTSSSYDIPGPLVLADVDGDGRADAVVVHSAWYRVGVYRQLATGSLAPEELFKFASAQAPGTHRMAVGDFNGDGKPDVVYGEYSQLSILYHQ